MTRFDQELDDAFEALKAELGRDPNSDEADYLRDKQFKDWIEAARFDELIGYIHDTYEFGGGFGDCDILSEALRKRGDLARIEKLFDGLVASRKTALGRVWPLAQTGHIGAMRESAAYLSAAMDALAGYYHGYWSLDDEAGKARIKDEMLRLQRKSQASP